MTEKHFEGTPSADDIAKIGFKIAKNLIEKKGHAVPVFLGFTLDKTMIPYQVDNDYMETEDRKDLLCFLTSIQMQADRVFKYAFINEVWIQRVVAKADERTPEEIAEQGYKEYQERGYSPSHGGGRDEAVMVVVGDEAEFVTYMWQMKRNAKGKVTGYEAMEKHVSRRDDPHAMTSRFGTLLFLDETSEGQTVN
jgi:hypothetical protein